MCRTLADEVIPTIERQFRVARDRSGRVLGGSSYGALVALHVALVRPEVFSGLLLESPSFYVDNDHVLRDASAATVYPDRVYVGVGTNELSLDGCPDHPGNAQAVAGVERLAAILRYAGFGERSLHVTIERCAVHSEEAWARRFPSALQFLFSP